MHPILISQKLQECKDEIEYIDLYLQLPHFNWIKMERKEGFTRKGIDYLLEKGYKVVPNLSAKSFNEVLIVVSCH